MATRDDIEVREANDPAEWDENLCNLAGAHPLQCWAWGEAKEAMGEKVVRLVVRHEAKIVAMAQVFGRKVTPLRIPVAWIPKGPAWDMETSFHRDAAAALKRALANRGFRVLVAKPYAVPRGVSLGREWPGSHANQTFWIDLTQPLEHLERALNKNWRYNRNRFFNRGGQVIDDPAEDAIEDLIRHHQDLAKRKGFDTAGSPELIRAVWKAFRARASRAVSIHIFRATLEGKLSGSHMFIRTGGSVHAFWGGFDYETRSVGPNEAIHWTVIRRMKATKVARYDLEGGAAKDSKQSSGVSEFKRRTGGVLVNLPRPVFSLLI